MAGEETIAALLAIWDNGTATNNWNELLPRLMQLVDQYEQSLDDDIRAHIAMSISDLLRDTAPDFYRLLIQTRKALRAGQASSRHGTRGVPPASEITATWSEIRAQEVAAHGDRITVGDVKNATGVVIGRHAQATVNQHYHEPRYTRYTDISCPRRVWIEERLTMTVALMLQPQPESIVQQEVESFAGKVKVRLTAPDFAHLSSPEQTIVIEPDEESLPVVFHLKPYRLGNCEIMVEFRQRERSIASVMVPVEVIDTQAIFEAVRIPSVPVNLLPGDV